MLFSLSLALRKNICLAALLLTACDGTTLGSFTVDESLPPTRVQGAGLVNVLPSVFPPMKLDVTASEAYESEDYNHVTGIRLSSLVFTVDPSSEDAEQDASEDGMPDDLSFLSAIDLYIRATIDGVERRERLAGVEENDPRLDPGARSVILDVSGIDILDFVEAQGGYEVQLEASGTPPPDDVIFGGTIAYRVGVGFK